MEKASHAAVGLLQILFSSSYMELLKEGCCEGRGRKITARVPEEDIDYACIKHPQLCCRINPGINTASDAFYLAHFGQKQDEKELVMLDSVWGHPLSRRRLCLQEKRA